MNEAAARDVLLVRAIETCDTEHAVLSRQARDEASREAAEQAHWRAAGQRAPAQADTFLVQRARLLLEALTAHQRAVRGTVAALDWRPWLDWALPGAALLAGLLFERMGDRGHVNVLAFPLLVLLLWNLAVYALLAAGWLRGRLTRAPRQPTRHGPMAWLRRLALPRTPRASGALAPALGIFVEDWLQRAAPLTGARAARLLHLAAALFALGALAGLYVRGLVFDYRAGWESTFLDAHAVHTLLSTLLGPAAAVLGQPFPGVTQIADLRFGPGAAGESAARWIHWYALTVAGAVIAPRLLLAALAAVHVRRLTNAFPLDLSAPYFRRLLSRFGGTAARARVVPFSYTLDAAAIDQLRTVVQQLLGEAAELDLRASTAYGDEASADNALAADAKGQTDVALDLALFNLAATPEQENHGAFLDQLRATLPGARALLVDEGPYRQRLGAQAGSATRLDERRSAWRAFAATRDWPIAFVDLGAPDLAQVERDLGPLLGQGT
jgi:hypothetical protein